MRETILKCVSDTRNTNGGGYTQPERLRERADDVSRFYDLHRVTLAAPTFIAKVKFTV